MGTEMVGWSWWADVDRTRTATLCRAACFALLRVLCHAFWGAKALKHARHHQVMGGGLARQVIASFRIVYCFDCALFLDAGLAGLTGLGWVELRKTNSTSLVGRTSSNPVSNLTHESTPYSLHDYIILHYPPNASH